MAFNPDEFLKETTPTSSVTVSSAFNPDEFLGLNQEPVSMTEQMVGLGSPVARFIKGAVANPLLAINQAGGAALGSLGQGIENVTGPNWFTQGLQESARGATSVAQQYEQATQAARKRVGSEGLDLVELGGSIVSPANRIVPGGPVVQGAAGAIMNPVLGENLSPMDVAKAKVEQAAIGGAFGKAFEAAIPAFKTGARKLLDAGADLEPGQAFGGVAGSVMRTAEGVKDTIFKIVGREASPDAVNKAFTYVTVNEALSPVGKAISKTGDDGFSLVKQGVKLARQAYDDAFSKVGQVTADSDFMQAINGIRNEARNTLDAKDYAKFEKEITNNIVKKFEQKTGVASTATGATPAVPETIFETNGQGLHNIKRFLQARLDNLSKTTDETGLNRKALYEDIFDNFKQFTYRIDPSGTIKNADMTWANMNRVADAAKKASISSGNFSPEQLATTAASQSTRFAGGTGSAPLQQYAKEALKIIGKDKTSALSAGDLKTAGVVSGLGYTGFLNPVVATVGGLFGLTAEGLGKLAVKNPELYDKFRTEAMKNVGLLSRQLPTPEQQGQ